MAKMTQTTKCIRCNKPAKMWTGYVLKRNDDKVLAGWCSSHCEKAFRAYCGPFKMKYGEESTEVIALFLQYKPDTKGKK